VGRRRDLLSVIETAYELDGTETEWCARLAESVYENVPFRTIGVIANRYDVSDPARLRLSGGFIGAGPDLGRLRARWDDLTQVFARVPERSASSYGSLDEGLGLEIPAPGGDELARAFAERGIGDVYGVNGRKLRDARLDLLSAS
jgi:hypothetical protein